VGGSIGTKGMEELAGAALPGGDGPSKGQSHERRHDLTPKVVDKCLNHLVKFVGELALHGFSPM